MLLNNQLQNKIASHSPKFSLGKSESINSCGKICNSFLTAIDERFAELLKKIPANIRVGSSLKLLTRAVTATPLIIAYYQEYISGPVPLVAYGLFVSLINNKAQNCFAKDIRKVIENSHLESNDKEGVALILNASKWADHNYAFAHHEEHLREIEIIAKKFIIEYKTVTSTNLLSKTIQNVCNDSKKPVKLVIIRGHGSLKEIRLSLTASVKCDDKNLLEALKKTDECAHIILQSCSTGRLRSSDGVSFADQLSQDLQGRMVTGPSNDAATFLCEHGDYPQGVTLGSYLDTQIDTHSFFVKDGIRNVKTLRPFKMENIQSNEHLKKCQSVFDVDARYKTETLDNRYTYHYNFSFMDLKRLIQLNVVTQD